MSKWLLIALAALVCWPRSGRYFPHAEPCSFTEALGWALIALGVASAASFLLLTW